MVFLREELPWQLFLGALLIFASILVVNWKPRNQFTTRNSGKTETL